MGRSNVKDEPWEKIKETRGLFGRVGQLEEPEQTNQIFLREIHNLMEIE